MLVIKNMQMPKKCSECPMCKQSGIDVYCGADYVGIDNSFKKRDNCPLVEIVTCKDCKHWDKSWKTSNGGHYCGMIDSCISDGNFYCANAERRK